MRSDKDIIREMRREHDRLIKEGRELERLLAEAQGKLDAVQRAVDAASDSGQYSLALVEIGALLDLERILSKEKE
ncbi:hypothetical protein LCGC14_1321080 [marine sediment metagenome]|uniref:Uncharacterized protein n=1 Tax=marine sediment metagenome TaxID=412755 RepID=A0A0F9NLX3_9ZZZZ